MNLINLTMAYLLDSTVTIKDPEDYVWLKMDLTSIGCGFCRSNYSLTYYSISEKQYWLECKSCSQQIYIDKYFLRKLGFRPLTLKQIEQYPKLVKKNKKSDINENNN